MIHANGEISKERQQYIKEQASDYVIGVVTARFNPDITGLMKQEADRCLQEYGVTNRLHLEVPGAFELPLAAQYLIEKKKCDAVVVLGVVIQGETRHFDFVCDGAEKGVVDLQLKYGVPVGFGVLTTNNDQQAIDRANGRYGNKGFETAEVVLEMLAIKDQLS